MTLSSETTQRGEGAGYTQDTTASGGRGRADRLLGLDVARALALIGVITMNYVVVWNLSDLPWRRPDGVFDNGPEVLRSLFDPLRGPLTTRFAATFMVIAGMGIGLANRGAPTHARKRELAWQLRRRGVVLFVIGTMFVWIWPGEILHYYGVCFVLASLLLGASKRVLSAAIAVVVTASIGVRVLVFTTYTAASDAFGAFGAGATGPSADAARQRFAEVAWLSRFAARVDDDGILRDERGQIVFSRLNLGSPRGLLADLAWGGTHPVLPWLSFVLLGMIVASAGLLRPRRAPHMTGFGALLIGLGSLTTQADRLLADRWDWLASTYPFEPEFAAPFGLTMVPYLLGAMGWALAAVGVVNGTVALLLRSHSTAGPIANRRTGVVHRSRGIMVWLVRAIGRAGRSTLTLYLAHGMVAWALTETIWSEPAVGLVGSLGIAALTWVVGVAAAAWWTRTGSDGPVERVVRRFCSPSGERDAAVRAAADGGTGVALTNADDGAA